MLECIESVWNQDYPAIELIVVDDGSRDHSKNNIKSALKGTQVRFIDIEKPVGNCKAFNKGFFASKGDFIIDLAADDVLMPDRVSKGIHTFLNTTSGVTFCNVLHIDTNGGAIKTHFRTNEKIPEGDIYAMLICKYFISPPSMMIKRKVLEELDGYDESLSYEDFDFWIRSARNWQYSYTNDVLIKKRVVAGSLSSRQFTFRTPYQHSTLKVCQKIKKLNRSKEERKSLRKRCFYEIRQCIRQGNIELIPQFLKLIL